MKKWQRYNVDFTKWRYSLQQTTLDGGETVTQNASKSTSGSMSYKNMLKRMSKTSDYPLRVRDLHDPSVVIDDPAQIKQKLTEYWSKLQNFANSVEIITTKPWFIPYNNDT